MNANLNLSPASRQKSATGFSRSYDASASSFNDLGAPLADAATTCTLQNTSRSAPQPSPAHRSLSQVNPAIHDATKPKVETPQYQSSSDSPRSSNSAESTGLSEVGKGTYGFLAPLHSPRQMLAARIKQDQEFNLKRTNARTAFDGTLVNLWTPLKEKLLNLLSADNDKIAKILSLPLTQERFDQLQLALSPRRCAFDIPKLSHAEQLAGNLKNHLKQILSATYNNKYIIDQLIEWVFGDPEILTKISEVAEDENTKKLMIGANEAKRSLELLEGLAENLRLVAIEYNNQQQAPIRSNNPINYLFSDLRAYEEHLRNKTPKDAFPPRILARRAAIQKMKQEEQRRNHHYDPSRTPEEISEAKRQEESRKDEELKKKCQEDIIFHLLQQLSREGIHTCFQASLSRRGLSVEDSGLPTIKQLKRTPSGTLVYQYQ